jgi:hypothetical protein
LLDKDDDDEEVNAANEGKVVSDSRGKKQSNRNSDSKKKGE